MTDPCSGHVALAMIMMDGYAAVVTVVWVFMISSSVLWWACFNLLSDIVAEASRMRASVGEMVQEVTEHQQDLERALIEMADQLHAIQQRRHQSPSEVSSTSTAKNVVGGSSSDDDIFNLRVSSNAGSEIRYDADGSLSVAGAQMCTDNASSCACLPGSSGWGSGGDVFDSDPEQIYEQGRECVFDATQPHPHAQGGHDVHHMLEHEGEGVGPDRQRTSITLRMKRRAKTLRVRRKALESASGAATRQALSH